MRKRTNTRARKESERGEEKRGKSKQIIISIRIADSIVYEIEKGRERETHVSEKRH